MTPCNLIAALSLATVPVAWAAATGKASKSNCKVTDAKEVSEAHATQLSSSLSSSCMLTDAQEVSESRATQLLQSQAREGGFESRRSRVPRLKQQLVEVVETGPCVWARPHNVRNRWDKPLCEDGIFSWHCKSEGHGPRVQCPVELPIMCLDKACDCDGESCHDYCCERDCTEKGGPRPADICPHPSAPEHGCAPTVPVDLIFLLDSSGSVGKDGFDQSRQYLREVVKRLPVDGTNVSTHVGIVQFSDTTLETVEIGLEEGVTQEIVNKAIDKMEWHKIHHDLNDPMTHTGEAIQYVLDHMFPKIRGGCSEMLVIITDGQSNGIKHPASIAALARETGVEVVAVGIENYGDDEVKKQSVKTELAGIVGNNTDKLLTVNKFSDLVNIVVNTSDMVCKHAEPTPTGPCPWATPHHVPNRQAPMCENGAFAWDCVGEGHGHRLQCPRSQPIMCNGKICGKRTRVAELEAQGQNHCCEVSESDCEGLKEGVRPTHNCPVPEPPANCTPTVPLDLIFLLDSSGSVGKNGFDQSRMFLKKVASGLPLDHGHVSTQIAIVQYSNAGMESVDLSHADGMTFGMVEHAVNAMTWHGTLTDDPMTHTGSAIEFILDRMFPINNGNRGNTTKHMLVLITDGQANGKKDPVAMAAKAQDRGIEIAAIGVAQYDYDELVNVTGDSSKVLTVKGHNELLSIVNETVKLVCNHVVAN